MLLQITVKTNKRKDSQLSAERSPNIKDCTDSFFPSSPAAPPLSLQFFTADVQGLEESQEKKLDPAFPLEKGKPSQESSFWSMSVWC